MFSILLDILFSRQQPPVFRCSYLSPGICCPVMPVCHSVINVVFELPIILVTGEVVLFVYEWL
jgi:hypothetical protein